MTVAHKAGAVALAVIAPTGVGSVVSAEPQPSDQEHCVLEVASTDGSAELVEQNLQCFATFAEAMASVGLPYETPGDLPGGTPKEPGGLGALSIEGQSRLNGGTVSMASGGVLATHFDASTNTGASITITGSDCGGGWLNLASSWANRISSTYNFCSNVIFYDDIDKTGASRATPQYSAPLGTFSNRAESVMYAT